MRCHKAQEFISLSLDDAIGEYDRSQLVQHLEGCSECAQYQFVLDRGSELLRSSPMAEPSENFEWKVQLGIQRALREGQRYDSAPTRQPGLWLSAGLSAVAAAVVVIGLGWVGLQSGALTAPARQPMPAAAHEQPGMQIVGNLGELNSPPNLDNAIQGPGYEAGRLDRGNVTRVSGGRRDVIPGVDELADPSLGLISLDDFLALQREIQTLRGQNRRQAELILSLQSHVDTAHISVVGDSGAAVEPR